MLPLQDNMPTASLFPQNLKRFLRNYQFVRCWNLFVWFSFQSLTVTQALFFMNPPPGGCSAKAPGNQPGAAGEVMSNERCPKILIEIMDFCRKIVAFRDPNLFRRSQPPIGPSGPDHSLRYYNKAGNFQGALLV